MKISILGRTWKITAIEPEAFIRRFEDELAGITLLPTREIVINADELNLSTVIHEITHAYIGSLCVSSASLTEDQYEELFCELMSLHGANLIALSKTLLSSLRVS